MDNRQIINAVWNSVKKYPNEYIPYRDYMTMLKEVAKAEGVRALAPEVNVFRYAVSQKIRENKKTELTLDLCDIVRQTYAFMSRDVFVDYMTYLEWDRPPAERFWQPRAKKLIRHADALQRLEDNELDELFLSQPPRTGKSTLALFFMTWVIGRNPELSNLYSAFSDTITKAFYNGLLEIINDHTTYLWSDVFPERKIMATNAAEETLDIDRKKRYASLTCRSLYGTLNGACDARGYIIADDLIGGIEEALNKDRLISAWQKCDNNLLPRAKESCKLLWWGTRWSQADPIGLRLDALQNDKRFEGHRYEVINIPALNDAGESNFEYEYGVGFSTKYYLMRKASFERIDDIASWNAQYMGQPIERTGVLFEPSEMRYFNGELPTDAKIQRKFMCVDPAFGGGDYCAGAILYQYETGEVFVVDVVYSSADKKYTQPLIAKKIQEWNVNAVQFECTLMTAAFKEKVEELLKDAGYRCNVTYKPASIKTSKELRIFDKAPEIREFHFVESQHRTKEYEQFMQNVFSFRVSGKNTHDDAPDCLAQCVDYMLSSSPNVRVLRRNIF